MEKEEISNYHLKIPLRLMKSFKRCLRKVYWEEGITINNAIIKLMTDFIKHYE